MDDKALRVAVEQFLKHVQFSAQREIEKVIRNAISSGKLKGNESITTGVTLSSAMIDLNLIYSKIELQ